MTFQLTRDKALTNYGRLVLRGFLDSAADAVETELQVHHGADNEEVKRVMCGIRSDIKERTDVPAPS